MGLGWVVQLIWFSWSPQLSVEVTIHNGIHCAGTCPLQHCQENCRGDHFLLHIDVHVKPNWSHGPAAPDKWHDKDRWALALRHAKKSLQLPGQVTLQAGGELCLPGSCLASAHDSHTWGLEAATAPANFLASITRDVWMGAAREPSKDQGLASPNLSEAVMHQLAEGSDLLPTSSVLDANPVLEASALQAMSDLAPWKHADDPVLLGCCKGALQRCLDTLARWAFQHKAAFHLSQKKSVAMVTPSLENQCVLPSCSHLVLPRQGGSPDRALEFKLSHKLLGIPCPADLDINLVLVTRVALAKKSFALLVGLAQRDTLPIHIVNSIFWQKFFLLLLWVAGYTLLQIPLKRS